MRKRALWLVNRGEVLTRIRSWLRTLATLGEIKALDRCAFLIVVPCLNEQEREWSSLVVISTVKAHGIVERLPASALNVAIQAPLRGRIVETRPCRADSDFVRILVPHLLVEVFQVVFAQVTAVSRPPSGSRLHPRIETSKIRSELCGGIVLIEKKRRTLPGAAMFHNAVPIDTPTLRENENHRMAVVCQISAAVLRFRADVCPISLVQSGQGFIRALAIVILSFVVQQCDVKMTLVGGFLQQPKVVIRERTALSIPVDDEG